MVLRWTSRTQHSHYAGVQSTCSLHYVNRHWQWAWVESWWKISDRPAGITIYNLPNVSKTSLVTKLWYSWMPTAIEIDLVVYSACFFWQLMTNICRLPVVVTRGRAVLKHLLMFTYSWNSCFSLNMARCAVPSSWDTSTGMRPHFNRPIIRNHHVNHHPCVSET